MRGDPAGHAAPGGIAVCEHTRSTMPMNVLEKILAAHSGRPTVRAGDLVECEVSTVLLLDPTFVPSMWPRIRKLDHPERIIVVFDHMVPADSVASAEAHRIGREFVREFGIARFHDIGRDQGIVHQLVSEHAYARPGDIIVCGDSHTCSGGAFNAAARGLGALEVMQAACTGRVTWECSESMHYQLDGALGWGVTPKDVFLYIAQYFGEHSGLSLEFDGPAVRRWSMNERRAFATMCAELGADFALFPGDSTLRVHLESRGVDNSFEPIAPDPDASYADKRTLSVDSIEPMVAMPNAIIGNAELAKSLGADVRIDQAFVGSCANGTIDDLRIVAAVVRGRSVASGTRFIVTPSSQAVYRTALQEGLVATIEDAGGVVTASSCGACAGLHSGVLAAGERAITSSTRNFQGRMGHPSSEVLVGSSATVAASAVRGVVTDPREFLA